MQPFFKSFCTWLWYQIFLSNTNNLYTVVSSSCLAASTDLPLLPPISIVNHSWEVFQTTACIGTELLYIDSSWLPYLCLPMWRGTQEYITYELILTTSAVSCMSGSSNLNSFHDRWYMSVQLLRCKVLPPELVHYSSQQFLCNCHQAFSPYV